MRLLRDRKFRGVAVQVGVVLGVFGLAAWLIGNVVANFAVLDKSFGFSFLWRLPANYDINQSLIAYSNQDTHLRAAVVGLLNTFLVAAVGIVLATVLGVAVGICRLSRNWLVAKLAGLYVELTRNTPVLLLILLWHGIIVNGLPHPRRALTVGGEVFLTNRGIYVPAPVVDGGAWAVIAVVAAGLLVALRLHGRVRAYAVAATIGIAGIVWVSAGASVGLDRPALQGFNFRGGMALPPEFVALTWGLAFYTSGFIAEIVRGGILAIDRGQTEAGLSLGLGRLAVLRFVVLPQALRVIVPPLTSEYLNLVKNSSLAIAIGYMDLVATLGGITLNQTGREIEAMILVMLVYLAISLAIAAFMNWYNRRIRLVER